MSGPSKAEAKSLVLVLGAGASNEVGFPLGSKLKGMVADALAFSAREQQSQGGDMDIRRCLDWEAAKEGVGEASEFIRAAHSIRKGMPQAPSIDNYIDSHRDDRRVAICGKLAIASCILKAERDSKLWFDPGNMYNTIRFENNVVESSWFNKFFQIINDGCQASNIANRLASVAIISFNYDRSVEHFLFHSLRNYYQMTREDAALAMRSLDIFHPYGTVGNLLWTGKDHLVDFGEHTDAKRLQAIAGGIKTFSEGTDAKDSDILTIRSVLEHANRIAFIGFAFHPLNMELLFPRENVGSHERVSSQRSIFGTSLGLSDSDVEVVEGILFSRAKAHPNRTTLKDCGAAALLNDYRRSLSL